MDNIIQLWKKNNKKVPFAVTSKVWGLDHYVVVVEVLMNGAFGFVVHNGKVQCGDEKGRLLFVSLSSWKMADIPPDEWRQMYLDFEGKQNDRKY